MKIGAFSVFPEFPKFLWRYVALCGAMNSVFFGVFPFFRNFCGAMVL